LPEENAEGQKALDDQWKLLDAAMERGKAFSTNKIRMFGFNYRPGQTATEKDYSRIYELVAEAARRAKAGGFRLALENVNGSFVETGAQSGELLKHVKEGNLGLTWDPNNAGAGGEKAFPDGYKKLDVARIFHVHLRDYKRGANGKMEWCAVGDGEFDNLGQIRALVKSGYKQTFTLETHWRTPKGKMYATDTSLKALLKVVKEV
jgi:sugar phosphate isomerase/epimerase